MSDRVRVRFAPSPTGPLHIGGVRTALYNYLFARKNKGTFILRIEDTDQGRYVPGAEEYIIESLQWLGIMPDEGPGIGGQYGPYRQSERKDLYRRYADELVSKGLAYYAFDTPEELEARRQAEASKGNHAFKYDALTRREMKNSLTLSEAEVQQRIEAGQPYVIRLLVPEETTVIFDDVVRGTVSFDTSELDDKVLIKADGMPTYHMANVVDDHLMQITHVIRGEEWLPSTGHHVLLYRAFGWEDTMPTFAHLPLILKPDGKGKLSKRDGARFGMPVFPLAWKGSTPDDSFDGFREFGFLPEAVINFLAFLGWNPGTEQEIFSLQELCQAFSLERINKSGARFDYDKALWYNRHYLQAKSGEELATLLEPLLEQKGVHPDDAYLAAVAELMKDRFARLPEFWDVAWWFFRDIDQYDEEAVRKAWSAELDACFEDLTNRLAALASWDAASLQAVVKGYIQEKGLKIGPVFSMLRVALAGSRQGPDLFSMMQVLGKERVLARLQKAREVFQGLL